MYVFYLLGAKQYLNWNDLVGNIFFVKKKAIYAHNSKQQNV